MAWIGVGEVAARLGLSQDTVRRYADRGLIPCIRLPSGYRRFRSEDVDAFLRDRRYVTWDPWQRYGPS